MAAQERDQLLAGFGGLSAGDIANDPRALAAYGAALQAKINAGTGQLGSGGGLQLPPEVKAGLDGMKAFGEFVKSNRNRLETILRQLTGDEPKSAQDQTVIVVNESPNFRAQFANSSGSLAARSEGTFRYRP